ncbi:porin [Comamonas testosteroni]|uniref:Porin n=1 Tax=Comamonas testosteroni TaxID=285 RepID=A0A096H330_COMTE|nr:MULTISPECIES: porin [Comamonas]KGH31850.1 porin [Comamonas testosteroni]KOC20566.1 porin [Comamonas testosteroni]KWT73525.1 Outer membrane porin protein 32 precursor [Comamonas testosteroni]MDN5506095.1 porin [Comamonas sp.]MDN5535733.1 porin [Comamonas sp.]
MKKSLIALAVLAASGAAMAQSSVTLFGIVDTGVSYVDNASGNDAKYGVHTSGNATSRLGLRGTEDLGGGLKAGFWLEGEIFGDDGNASGFNFKRESTVRLSGNFGEVRLGRETTPTFRAGLKYDLFGATGIGQNLGFKAWSTAGGAFGADANTIRANNMVSYSSPNFSGFTANVSYAFDEKQGVGKTGRYAGGNVGYDNGPLSVTAAYGTLNGGTGDRDEMSIGASYNFGVAKVVGNVQQIKYKPDAGSSAKFRNYLLGVSAPVGGVGEVKAQYAYYDQQGPAKAHQLSLGYVHNLSKRTALYGTVAYLKNQDGSAIALAAKGVSDTVGLKADGSGRNQAGVQVGIRHAF